MLNWPDEIMEHNKTSLQWSQVESNNCLDFHGDPLKAKLVVLSDGNHHMALQETLNQFCYENRELKDVFYATTPPGPIVELLKSGSLRINNLVLSVKPHLFISPPHVLAKLVDEGYIENHRPFMKNRGNVLLVKKGNPLQVRGVNDLFRNDIRLFLSNPETETVSYNGYINTIRQLAANEGIDLDLPEFTGRVLFGECIHHREAPQSLENGRADVAIVYYHLALRYTRIFPNLFEIVPLGGTIENPLPGADNVVSHTDVGLVHNGGRWGALFLEYLMTDKVTEIYNYHGLQRS